MRRLPGRPCACRPSTARHATMPPTPCPNPPRVRYITHLSAFWTLTVSNILVLIQSSAHSARYLQSRIDAFLPKVPGSGMLWAKKGDPLQQACCRRWCGPRPHGQALEGGWGLEGAPVSQCSVRHSAYVHR